MYGGGHRGVVIQAVVHDFKKESQFVTRGSTTEDSVCTEHIWSSHHISSLIGILEHMVSVYCIIDHILN